MEVMAAISAISQGIGIVKDLREIDRGVDSAEFKLKLAEISSALADAKIALSEARLLMINKDVSIQELEAKLQDATNGEVCPKCRLNRLSLIASAHMSMGGLGRYGVEEWTFACSSKECGFETKKVHDPQGLVVKFIGKK